MAGAYSYNCGTTAPRYRRAPSMLPLFILRAAPGKSGPVVLPHYLASVVDLESDGWPQAILLTPGFGLVDPAAGIWHGLDAANDERL